MNNVSDCCTPKGVNKATDLSFTKLQYVNRLSAGLGSHDRKGLLDVLRASSQNCISTAKDIVRSRRVVTEYVTQYNTIQYNTMENLHSKTDKHTVSLI